MSESGWMRGSFKRCVLTLLRVAISLGLILFLVRQVSPNEVMAILRASAANWPLLLVVAALPGLGAVITAVRWRVLLGGLGVHPSLKSLLEATLVGSFFNTFLPSTIGGDVMRGWWIREEVGSATQSLTVVALDRLIGLLAFCVVGLLAAALVPSILHDAPAVWIVAAGAVVGLAALLGATQPATQRMVRPLFDVPILRRIRDKAKQAAQTLVSLRRARSRVVMSFAIGILLQLNVIAQFLILAATLELGIDLWQLAVLVPIVNLITLLPVSINGFGVREAALAALGGPFGLSVGGAVLLAYAWVVFALLWGLVGGLVYLRGRPDVLPVASA
jgi:glycosyltransferase 2 family protein